ncbi:MAG: hypothetical protein ABSH03_13050 [Candidatus Lustribacter sp.]|jgi:quercetin dioxygenase-like cupin family protein
MDEIREFMTGWPPAGGMSAWSIRHKAGLRGTASGKRKPPKLRPFDLVSKPHVPVPLLENPDMRVSVDSAAGPAPWFRRNINFDEVIVEFAGESRVETEMGVFTLAPGEVLLIPRGIAHRSIGDRDALRMIVYMREPVTSCMTEEQCTSRTAYTMRRIGGPDYSAAAAVPAPSGRVTEKMFLWDENPADAVEVERDTADLIDVGSTKRDEKISAVKKMRPFDLFADITGRHGPGPKWLSSPVSMMEVYNTIGEQFAFHRALESEEFGLQFLGENTNMSEFEDEMPMSPGDWFLIPLGIAHSVKDCKGDFRRMVIYSHYPFRVLANDGMHVHQSRFEVEENVIEPAPWHAEAKVAV